MKHLLGKRIVTFTLTGLVAAVISLTLPTVFEAYQMYSEAVGTVSIDERIAEIRADKDYVPINQISTDFLNAVVAIEDHRFYKHNGIDLIATSRAMITNLTNRNSLTGGSTLTQQLSKNMYFTFEKKYSRKLAELAVAIQLEHRLSKEEILELYANVVYFGNGYNGVTEAADGYFGIEPKDLSMEQSIMLAGIPQSPNKFELNKPTKSMGKRTTEVINAMIKGRFLASEDARGIQLRTLEVIETVY